MWGYSHLTMGHHNHHAMSCAHVHDDSQRTLQDRAALRLHTEVQKLQKCVCSHIGVTAADADVQCQLDEKLACAVLRRRAFACAGLRLLADAEVDEVVASIEAEKAAAEAARRGPSSMSS